MGKIVVKAQQQTVFNKDKSGVKSNAYVLRPVRYSTMNSNDIVNYCAANSIVPKAYLSASMIALAQCIENFLLNGHSVEFPNLGIFSLSSNGVSETDVNKAGIAQLTKLNVRFLPCTQLKTEVENVDLEFDGVYDIAGENEEGTKYYRKVVRRLTAGTSDNAGDTNTGGGNGGNTGGGGTQGGGSNTGTDSGNTGQSTLYTLSISSADASQGSVDTSVNKQYSAGSRVTIKATPASGYAFDKWSDGSTVNPRNITLNQDITLTATFKTATVTPPGEDDDDSPFDGGM